VPSESSAAERVKAQQLKHWNDVAAGWAGWLEWTERNFVPVTDWLCDATVWRRGSHVLDVACGAGYPALVGAAAVQPDGRIVATDISPQMVMATRRRATALGLHNIEVVEMDAEHLRFGDNVFDAVTNAYGLMFCPDLARALSEAHRVLKPGGRAAFVTWDDRAKSPFFDTMLPIAAKFLSLAPPNLDAPGPFRLSAPSALESLLSRSGFKDVRVESRPMRIDCGSAAEYCQLFSDIAWKARIASLTEAAAAQFRESVADATRPYLEGDRLRLVATSLCVTART
jgi:enediyne biosynthesis protein CalE5